MFERISRGWGIAKASWSVLKQHPKLMLLPILSGLAFIGLLGLIWASVFAGGHNEAIRKLLDNAQAGDALVYAVLFAIYFAATFIFIFFNAALVFCAMQCFAGRTPSLSEGLATAAGRLPQILAWTLLASTVGILLNAIQNFLKDRLGFLGSLLGGLVETGWAVITYFVVPVLVVEAVGPVDAVKRSSSIVKQTWGEAVGGEGGLSLISFFFFLPAILVVGLGGTMFVNAHADPTVAAIVIGLIVVPYLLALTIVFTALGTIFRTGAYIYATTGKAPAAIDQQLLAAAFRSK